MKKNKLTEEEIAIGNFTYEEIIYESKKTRQSLLDEKLIAETNPRINLLLNKERRKAILPLTKDNESIPVEERLEIVTKLLEYDKPQNERTGEFWKEYRETIEYLNEQFELMDSGKLTKKEMNETYRYWAYKLQYLDIIADYLCICKGSEKYLPNHKDSKHPKPIRCYDEKELRRSQHDTRPSKAYTRTLKIKQKDGTYKKIKIKYPRPLISDFSTVSHNLRKRNCDTLNLTDTDIVNNAGYKNNQYYSIETEKEILANQFSDDLEKQIAELIMDNCTDSEIIEILKITDYQFNVTLKNMQRYFPEYKPYVSERKTAVMRVCKKCGEEKPITEFTKEPRMKFGYSNTCKNCDSNRHKKPGNNE